MNTEKTRKVELVGTKITYKLKDSFGYSHYFKDIEAAKRVEKYPGMRKGITSFSEPVYKVSYV